MFGSVHVLWWYNCNDKQVRRNALLGKKDIANAFRLLPICPEDFPLLGFHFNHNYYIDNCLTFGCSIDCMYNLRKISHIITLDYPNYSKCRYNGPLPRWLFVCGPGKYQYLPPRNEFDHVCQQFVVPISHEKSDGPTISITFYIFRPWHRHHQSVNIRAPDRVIALKVLLSSSIS